MSFSPPEPVEKLVNHVINHVIAFSIIYHSSANGNKNISIIHDNEEIEEIANNLMHLFDMNDLRLDVMDVPFIACPCKIYNNRCDSCKYVCRMFSINNFQQSPAYNMYILTHSIMKTYFCETTNYLLDKCCEPFTKTMRKCFFNWFSHQKITLQTIFEFIADNWDDLTGYDNYYKCKFNLKNFEYMHRIGCDET